MDNNTIMRQALSLHSKGWCLLCFKNVEESSPPSSSFSLQDLFKYLRINLESMLGGKLPSPTLSSSLFSKSDLKVSLCGGCASVNQRFSELFLELRKIQAQVNHCLKIIHQVISETDSNSQLIENYQKLMTTDLNGVFQLGFITDLRREVLSKCLPEIQSDILEEGDSFAAVPININVDNHHHHHDYSLHHEEKNDDKEENEHSASVPVPSLIIKEESELPPQNTIEYYSEASPLPNHNPNEDEFTDLVVFGGSTTTTESSSLSFQHTHHHQEQLEMEMSEASTGITETQTTAALESSVLQQLQSRKKSSVKTTKILNKSRKNRDLNINAPPYFPTSSHSAKDLISNCSCHVCGKQFKHLTIARNHYQTVHLNIRKYSCEFCCKKFKEQTHLREHLNRTHLATFKCEGCNKTSGNKAQLLFHVKNCDAYRKAKNLNPNSKAHHQKNVSSSVGNANGNNFNLTSSYPSVSATAATQSSSANYKKIHLRKYVNDSEEVSGTGLNHIFNANPAGTGTSQPDYPAGPISMQMEGQSHINNSNPQQQPSSTGEGVFILPV